MKISVRNTQWQLGGPPYIVLQWYAEHRLSTHKISWTQAKAIK